MRPKQRENSDDAVIEATTPDPGLTRKLRLSRDKGDIPEPKHDEKPRHLLL